MEMDQLNMLSLAFEIRTDVAAKWSVNALLLGYALIFQENEQQIIGMRFNRGLRPVIVGKSPTGIVSE